MPQAEKESQPRRGRLMALLVALALIIFVLVVMGINSRKPAHPEPAKFADYVKGLAFVNTNQLLLKQMEPNWLANDVFWPTVLLDNMPNFQSGQLEVVRYNIRVLRDNLTRMRTTDTLDPTVEAAFTFLANDPAKWWFPSFESRLREADASLETYRTRLLGGTSYFYARADNLAELLNQYASLMGGVNTRLLNAPGDITEVLKESADQDQTQLQPEIKAETMAVAVPWHRVDDNFYYAQGVAYALYQSLRAVRVDFLDVLIDKNSLRILDKVLEDLRRCYFEPWIVFNGTPDSIFANHSLNLSSLLNDARQKINSLIVAVMQG